MGKQKKKKSIWAWVVAVFFISFFVTALLSWFSSEVLEELHAAVALLILSLFIAIGILFDMIGLAVATADIKQFNSMAARRIKAGKKGVWLINNAEKVSSFCNDVVGDIAGVVSGSTAVAVALALFDGLAMKFLYSLIMTSLVAALTVGGKAVGKIYAIKYNGKIVSNVAKILCIFSR